MTSKIFSSFSREPCRFIALLFVFVIFAIVGSTLAVAQETDDVLYRVNAGGSLVAAEDDGPDWSADLSGNQSQFLIAGGDHTAAYPVDSVESTVPASTPEAIFQTERWDPIHSAAMQWQFPVAEGTPVEVRLYLMNGFEGTQDPGDRVFNIEIDGDIAFSNVDLSDEAGHRVGTVRIHETVADGMIDIRFLHVEDNPLINGIEIVQTTMPEVLWSQPTGLNFGNVVVGSDKTLSVTLTNQGGDGDPSITIDDFTISDPTFTTNLTTGVSLAPGDELETEVTFAPDSLGSVSATLDITHTGSNTPLTIDLAGAGADLPFTSQFLTSRLLPTQLEIGPDGRLYVAELEGLIYAFTIERDEDTGEYSIVDTEVIDLIQTIPNHDDDGTPHAATERSMTGMVTAGTATNPVLFVTSSDPRTNDPDADTNSGTLSRLTWTGSEWEKLDLVRSLPRSLLDHFPNGLALDAENGIMYLAQGGNTNMGAPSGAFHGLPEYALSGAILSIDLNAIGETTYDIPTLNNQVFGGQGGDNQAMIVSDGPVQVHAPGFRNPYDVLLTSAGRLYTYDRHPTEFFGGIPVGEGTAGNCTNDPNEGGSATHPDNFHLVSGLDYYGGHPNPTRANRDNTFNGQSPIPEGLENAGECEYQTPGQDGAIALSDAATNGLAEYTATAFDGQMTGNIIVALSDGRVMRLSLNEDGDEVIGQNDLFTNLPGARGVTAQGDTDPFPGTIWIAQFDSGDITVFEPEDVPITDPDPDGDEIFHDRFEAAED